MADPVSYYVALGVTEAQGAILDGMNCGSVNCKFAHSQLKGTANTACRCIAQLKANEAVMAEDILMQVIRSIRGETPVI